MKTYLWSKSEDKDYVAPKIQIISKDIFLSKTINLKTIIEAISLKD